MIKECQYGIFQHDYNMISTYFLIYPEIHGNLYKQYIFLNLITDLMMVYIYVFRHKDYIINILIVMFYNKKYQKF